MYSKIFGMCLFVLCLVVSVQAQQVNILSGGKVIAPAFVGMPYYIYEGDYDDSPVLTRNGEIQDPSYIGVLRNRRLTVETVIFNGGLVSEDGGWFDSSESKPELQIMREPGGDWETIATFEDYPELDGVDNAAAQPLHQDQPFQVDLDPPVSCVGVRVAGTAASGNDDTQSHISLSELRAYGDIGEVVDTYDPGPLSSAFPIASNFRHPLERGGGPGGDVIIDGYTDTYARCEELEAFDFMTFFGFYSGSELTLTSVSFVHGEIEEDGWFNTENQDPTVEIKRTLDSEWEAVGTFDYPETNLNSFPEDLPEDIGSRVFTYEFAEPTTAWGVRIVGNGSFNLTEVPFVQVAEIMFEGEGTTTYQGPQGTGLHPDGNPIGPGDDGNIFIEAEWGRSVNDAYEIQGHGDASGGLVARMSYTASFNSFSGRIIEYDIVVPEDNLYFMFGAGDSAGGWTDSLFVLVDTEMTPATIDGWAWRPPNDLPLIPVIFERDWVTSDTIGQDGQELYDLDAGEHTIRIGLREPRYTLDWLVVTTDEFMDINAYQPPNTPFPTGIVDFSLY